MVTVALHLAGSGRRKTHRRDCPGGVGDGDGDWRLELGTDLDIEPLAFVRTDGFVTSVHDVVEGESMRWRVPVFNPGSNTSQRSRLRVINSAGGTTEVTIAGRDDRGEPPPGGDVHLTLRADTTRSISAQELESGGSGFRGSFGDGMGKWQLFISADRPIQAMSLLESPTGYLSNLSSPGVVETGAPVGDLAPADQAAFRAIFVGKVIVGTQSSADVAYYRFLEGGRFTDTTPEDGDTEAGRYTYQRAGSYTGTIGLSYDDRDRCSASLTFASATTGTFTTTCSERDSRSGSWRTLRSPRIEDLAPADQEAFDALVIGRVMAVTDAAPYDNIRFFAGNRITLIRKIEDETDPDLIEFETETGSYTYQGTGSQTGTIEISYDDGGQCSLSMAFTSATAGSLSSICDGSQFFSGSWRLHSRTR